MTYFLLIHSLVFQYNGFMQEMCSVVGCVNDIYREDSPLCQHKRSCILRISHRCHYSQKAIYLCRQYNPSREVYLLEAAQKWSTNAWLILNTTLVNVVKSSVIKMLDSTFKGLAPSDQTLDSCNLPPTCLGSCHLRKVPHPFYSVWKLNHKVE